MTTIRTAGKDIALETSDGELLADELRAIATGSQPLADAHHLARRLESAPSAPIDLDDHERFLALRATDHLRSLSAGSAALRDLRDHLIDTGATRWIAYTLDFRDGRPPVDFTSYSLAYNVLDRLITGAGDPLRVVEIIDMTTLVVEEWDRSRTRAVQFTFAPDRGITGRQALQLADRIATQRNLAAQSLAKKLRDEARHAAGITPPTRDLELEPAELEQLAAVLDEEHHPDDQAAFAHLRAAIPG